MTKLDLSRRYCHDGNEHAWKIYRDGGCHESVGCARCMVTLSTIQLLLTYVTQYGGSIQA